ncbi:MAG TPA: YheU family protein [Pseudomonadales bacterium]|nr:YheU family protein [Pseudomonadales bacterium]HNC70634.1 YheU family protein [Pseudomonadales bacterium]
MSVVEVSWRALSSQALLGVIEEFATREGTEYGEREVSLDAKVEQIRRQIERGEVSIFFDDVSGSCQLLTREQAAPLRSSVETAP